MWHIVQGMLGNLIRASTGMPSLIQRYRSTAKEQCECPHGFHNNSCLFVPGNLIGVLSDIMFGLFGMLTTSFLCYRKKNVSCRIFRVNVNKQQKPTITKQFHRYAQDTELYNQDVYRSSYSYNLYDTDIIKNLHL